MNDIWVCDSCRSINRQRDSVCYHCRAPQSGALETPGLDVRMENAALERSVRQYLPAWPLALVAGLLIVAVAILGLVLLRLRVAEYPAIKQAFVDAIATGGQSLDGALVVQSVQMAFLSLIRFGLTLGALLVFAGWLALVTRNVPLLGGGSPSRSPVRVFIYALIPLWNLIKVPGMLQDLLYRVDPRSGGAFMVLAAWVGLVGSWFVSLIGGWAISAAAIRTLLPAFQAKDVAAMAKGFSDVLDQLMWLEIIVEVMIAVGAILLAVIMGRVEARCAARDREIKATMAASGAPTPPTGPSWGDPAASSPVPDPDAPPAGLVATSPAPPSSPVPAPVDQPVAAAGSALPAAASPSEPNWPQGRPWPGSLSRTAGVSTDDLPLSSAVDPATPPAPPAPAAEPPGPPPGPPPPP